MEPVVWQKRILSASGWPDIADFSHEASSLAWNLHGVFRLSATAQEMGQEFLS